MRQINPHVFHAAQRKRSQEGLWSSRFHSIKEKNIAVLMTVTWWLIIRLSYRILGKKCGFKLLIQFKFCLLILKFGIHSNCEPGCSLNTKWLPMTVSYDHQICFWHWRKVMILPDHQHGRKRWHWSGVHSVCWWFWKLLFCYSGHSGEWPFLIRPIAGD